MKCNPDFSLLFVSIVAYIDYTLSGTPIGAG